MPDKVHHHRRRAIALLMTLLLVVLLVAAVSRTATTAAVASIRAAHCANNLQHRLAVDGVLRVAAAQVLSNDDDRQAIEHGATQNIRLVLANCVTTCTIMSDASKLSVRAFERREDRILLARKLTSLQQRLSLANAEVRLQPTLERASGRGAGQVRMRGERYLWFDQLFENTAPEAYFVPATFQAMESGPRAPDCWSEAVTLWGDGRVDVLSANHAVLRVLLDDVDPTAADAVLNARNDPRKPDPLAVVLNDCDENTRRELQRRLGRGIARYALYIQTTIETDQRHWYVVTDLSDASGGVVYYRGQVQW